MHVHGLMAPHLVSPHLTALRLTEPVGEGWTQIIELVFALVFSSLIGLERELGHKSAGLRTHALVGVGAALFMLVSKYGFTDVRDLGNISLDPSRVAAQIVSGIGFIGGGLIFVRRNSVQGLTTAAVVWVTAAVGSACGAGLPILAGAVTGGHFLVTRGYPRLKPLLGLSTYTSSSIQVRYLDGRGLLRTILAAATAQGFAVTSISTQSGRGPRDRDFAGEPEGVHDTSHTVDVILQVEGAQPVNELASGLSEIDGVLSVTAGADELAE